MDRADRLKGFAGAVVLRVVVRVGVTLTLALLAMVSTWLFSGEARAYGPTNGQWGVYPCWTNANKVKGYPSTGHCAMSYLDIRDADAEFDLAGYRATYLSYSYTFQEWVSCTETGGCSYKYRKTLKADSNNYSVITNGISFDNNPQNQQKCTGAGYQSLANGSCVCSAGYAPDASGACAPQGCPAPGTKVPGTDGKTYVSSEDVGSGFLGCFDGCLVSGAFGANSGGVHYVAGPLVHVGTVCNPDNQGGAYPPMGDTTKSGAEPPVTSCPPPQCPGTVNGTSVCVACDSTGTGDVTKNPDGTGTETTTTCIDGVCTTTTRDVGSDGTAGDVTGSRTGTGGGNPQADGTGSGGGSGDGSCTGSDCQPMPSFCEDNPDSPVCQNSTWAGTCAAAFTCDGDEVQCAIAKEQHTRNCTLFVNETDDTRKANDAHGAGDQPPGHPGFDPQSSSIDFTSTIDRTDLLGGTCPAGYSVTLGSGQSLTILTDAMCDSLAMVGNLVVAFASLLSVFIVFRG